MQPGAPKLWGRLVASSSGGFPHLDVESLLLRKLRSSFRPSTPPVPSPASCSTSDPVAPPLLWQTHSPSSGQVSVPGAKKSSAYWTQPRASRPDVKAHPLTPQGGRCLFSPPGCDLQRSLPAVQKGVIAISGAGTFSMSSRSG